MVGGIADWFAVTALFRHPLGIPIPHTAIVPARKDRIGTALGNFVQRNFLQREVVAQKLAAMKLGERAARWLAAPENSRRIARHVATGLSGAVNVLRDEEVQAVADRAVDRAAAHDAGGAADRACLRTAHGGRTASGAARRRAAPGGTLRGRERGT